MNDVLQKDTMTFGAFDSFEKMIDLKDEWLISEQLKIVFLPIPQDTYDWFSVTNFELRYPKKIATDESYFQGRDKANFTVATDSRVYAISDKWNVTLNEIKSSSFSAISGESYFVSKSFLSPNLLGKINFEKYQTQKYNYIILTESSLISGAKAYSQYRASENGGSFSTLIVTAEELYNQFTYGFKNPMAIRRFSDFLLQNKNETVHLFLLGRAVTFPDELKGSVYKDLVPSFGYPGSDVLLTAGTGNEDEDVPGMSTGRLNVTKNEQILNYLAKVKETEAAPIGQSWKKKMLHLSGGKEIFEIEQLANLLENIKPKATQNLLGADIKSLRKQSLAEIEAVDISKEVNDGVGMITFAGHGSANIIDLNIGYCSVNNSAYKNKGKYPLMFFNGCGVGNVFYRYELLTTDWLITPDKGAIAIFANSFWSYFFPTQVYLNSLYEHLFVNEATVNLTLGEIHQAINRDLSAFKSNPYILANMHQMILQGDPAIKMFPLEAADFAISDKGFQLKSLEPQKSINSGDSLIVHGIIENLGKYEKESQLNINVQIDANGKTNSHTFRRNSFSQKDTLNFKVPSYKGITKVELALNTGIGNLKELRFDNNKSQLLFDNWEAAAVASFYPTIEEADNIAPLLYVKVNGKLLENNDFISASSSIEIRLLDEKSLENSQDQLFDIKLFNEKNELLEITLKPLAFTNANSVLTNASVNLIPGSYRLNVSANDRAGNDAKPYEINFRVSEGRKESSMVIYPNPININSETQLSYQLISSVKPVIVELLVYNSLGQLVKNELLNSSIGKNQESLIIKSLTQGTYTAKLKINWSVLTEVLTCRFVVP